MYSQNWWILTDMKTDQNQGEKVVHGRAGVGNTTVLVFWGKKIERHITKLLLVTMNHDQMKKK